MAGFQSKIEIHQSNPKIWRRIIILYGYTFYKFHLAIQGAFGCYAVIGVSLPPTTRIKTMT
jgi:hypothetical protein